MLAVIAPSQPVAAALAAPNECCSVPSTSSVQQQHARDAVNTLQQAMSATASKMGMLQLQHTDQDVSSCVPAASPAVAPAPSPAGPAVQLETTSSSGSATGTTSRRRLSRSERKAVAPPVAGYSTDSYWNTRYAERSTHFDWFYNHSALAELINSTCDSQAGPCLHVGCGNSGFSEGMVQDGFQVTHKGRQHTHMFGVTSGCPAGRYVSTQPASSYPYESPLLTLVADQTKPWCVSGALPRGIQQACTCGSGSCLLWLHLTTLLLLLLPGAGLSLAGRQCGHLPCGD